MHLPQSDIRLAHPNPADNAPAWEEDPDRLVARLASEPGVSAVARIGGSQQLHVVLRGRDGRPLPAEETERLLADHGLEVLHTGTATEVVVRPRPVLSTLGDAVVPSVDVTLSGAGGPRATFRDDTGAMVVITALNRVSLVYFLAEAVRRDRDAGTDTSDGGWRSNHQASIAVWGRAGGSDPRRLKSLVFNLRAELRAGGIDPWSVDKRRGAVRLRVRGVRVW